MGDFACNKCKKTFGRKYELTRHQNRITSCVSGSKTNKKINYYHCNKCKQKFSRKDSLTRHSKLCKIKLKGNNNIISEIKGDNNKFASNSLAAWYTTSYSILMSS